MQKLRASFSPNLLRILRLSTTTLSRPDFLPSYLVTKFGFSPDKAAKAALLVPRRVCSPDQPDSVVTFFKSHGFDDSHLKKIIAICPTVLALSVEETISPRFDAFRELGFKGDDLVTLVYSNPNILNRNMEHVVPKIELWRSLIGSHTLLMKCLAQIHWQIVTSSIDTTTRNISLLKECGLSDHQISIVVSKRPFIIKQKTELLKKLVARAESLGLTRGSPNLHWAIYTLTTVTEDNVLAKVKLFKGFGWSDEDFTEAFRKSPGFFTSSDKMLVEKMEFLVKEAGCTASYIALNPVLLTLSIEKRLRPRLKVLKALKEKGLSGGNVKMATAMVLLNNTFFERYVAPYKELIPQLSQLFSASS